MSESIRDAKVEDSSADHERFVDECRRDLQRLGAAAKPRQAEWLSLDLSMGQLKALFVLTTQGARSVGILGRALAIGESAASLLVDKLEERGLARREDDPQDRRRRMVVPTEEATALAVRLRRARDEQLTGWLTRLSGPELRDLHRGLRALVYVAEGTDSAETPQIEDRSMRA